MPLMMVKWGVNVTMLLLVALLAAFILWKGKEHPDSPRPLVVLDRDSLQKLTLDHAEHLEFFREGGVWKMSQPFSAPVAQVRLAFLLEITQAVPKAEYPLPEPSELKSFGLDPPLARLRLDDTEVLLGSRAPLNQARYVAVNSHLYLIDDQYFRPTEGHAVDFVEKKLLPDGFGIHSIRLPELKVLKGTDERWSSTPPHAEVDLADFVMQWSLARAIEVRREPPGQVLGETIEISGDSGVQRFTILQKTPELILGRDDLGLSFVMYPEAGARLMNISAQGDRKPSLSPENPGPKDSETQGDEPFGPK